MGTKLILIRHGQTAWNIQKRYCGSFDIALNASGKKQIKKLRLRLKKEKVHSVYASCKKRAVESARIIFRDKDIEIIPDLREIHFGVFEGLNYKQVMKKYPRIYKKWLKDPYKNTMPGAEELKGFSQRVLRAIKAIVASNKGRTAAIISHGGPISAFINHILGSRDFWRQIPSSASLSIVEYRNHKAKIRLFNDTSHL